VDVFAFGVSVVTVWGAGPVDTPADDDLDSQVDGAPNLLTAGVDAWDGDILRR